MSHESQTNVFVDDSGRRARFIRFGMSSFIPLLVGSIAVLTLAILQAVGVIRLPFVSARQAEAMVSVNGNAEEIHKLEMFGPTNLLGTAATEALDESDPVAEPADPTNQVRPEGANPTAPAGTVPATSPVMTAPLTTAPAPPATTTPPQPPITAPRTNPSSTSPAAVTTNPPTNPPTSGPPTSQEPSTTSPPATIVPTTVSPTTAMPTSVPPTIVPPTTAPPTTAPPTTAPPTTAPVSTAPPTTTGGLGAAAVARAAASLRSWMQQGFPAADLGLSTEQKIAVCTGPFGHRNNRWVNDGCVELGY